MPGDEDAASRFDPARAVSDEGISGALDRVLEADARIEKRYAELGGEGFFGPVQSKDTGTMWTCRYGCLFHDDNQKVFEIHGDIYAKWSKLGALTWGVPCTDELKTPDGIGRYNHFNNDTASIYWTPDTGANAIYGEIRKRWIELGRETSYLGYPTTDEVEFADGGRANDFQNGGIYFWADTGPIDMRDVVVHYTGLHCFGETDSDQMSTGDEPYAILGVTTPQASGTVRTQVYGGIDAGESCPDQVEVFRGRPYGINIATVVLEHDFGDPEKYKEEVHKVVSEAHETGKTALGYVPIVGPALAAAAEKVLDQYVPKVSDKINTWLDWGDDTIGSTTVTLTAKDMVLLATRTQNTEFDGIGFKAESELISGHGASYKAYYGLVPA